MITSLFSALTGFIALLNPRYPWQRDALAGRELCGKSVILAIIQMRKCKVFGLKLLKLPLDIIIIHYDLLTSLEPDV